MDLIKINLPAAVEVGGRFYDIHTDFRKWILFSRLLKNENSEISDADFLYIYDKPTDRKKGLEALFNFYAPPHELPRKVGRQNNAILIDYDIDAELIYSAFLEVYGIDLLSTDGRGHAIELHWHKFTALLNGLHGTRLNEIMQHRAYDPNDKTPAEKIELQLKQQWEIKKPETKKEREAREEFNALFSKK